MAYKHRLDLTMGMPKGMNRMDQFPLDMSSVYYDYATMENYAKTSAIAYVGQPLSLVDETNKVVTLYTIQDTEGTLKKVGTSPIGDESTISVAEDGTVSLYGISGLALEREVEDEDGNKSTIAITYQPLYVNGKLTWVEPSTTTVEGLAAEIEGIKTRISTIETVVGDSESGLVKSVADNTAEISNINDKIGEVAEDKTIVEMIADAKTEATYDDTSIANRIKTIEDDYLKATDKTDLISQISTAKQEAISTILGETVDADFDTLQEVAAWIQSDTTNSTQLINRVTAIENDYLKGADKTELEGEIADIESYVGILPEDAESTNVVDYIDEVIDGLNISDYAKAIDLTSLTGRVTTTETKLQTIAEGAQVNVIDSVDETQFAIDSNKKLTLLDVAIDKVTGLQDALNSKVTAEDGKRLITTEEADKLAALVVGAQENTIESILINNVELEITNKQVNIPIGTEDTLGVVASSANENKVAIATDGTMEVNSLNVNKLVQTTGDTLILDGGSSSSH